MQLKKLKEQTFRLDSAGTSERSGKCKKGHAARDPGAFDFDGGALAII